MASHEPTQDPYGDELSLPTLMGLMATYTEVIQLTNALGEDVALANGCVWAGAFVFSLPQDLVRAEVNRMAQWCLAHRAEVEAAKLDDLTTREGEER
jgi:hypothetical protein